MWPYVTSISAFQPWRVWIYLRICRLSLCSMCISNTWFVPRGMQWANRHGKSQKVPSRYLYSCYANLCSQLSPVIMYSKVFVALNVITVPVIVCLDIHSHLLTHCCCFILYVLSCFCLFCACCPLDTLSQSSCFCCLWNHIGLVCYGRIWWAVNIHLHSVSSLEVQLPLDKITDEGILTNSPYL